ncbi:MAG: tetratricopeptide repeat protein [Thermodesulfobacteriota bacterium]|nr:tetratricopeptide repeat protein [Thermodesulfobacteriota bacterium]
MKKIFPLLVLLLLSASCASVKDIETLDARYQAQEQNIETLSKQRQKIDKALTPIQQNQAETNADIKSMRVELAEALGRIELLERQIQALHTDRDAGAQALLGLTEDLEDLKAAWRQMASQLGFDVDLETVRAKRVSTAQASANATETEAETKAAPEDPAQNLYDSARAAFEAKEYGKGQLLWEEFATTFPKHDLVSNALFWQGECYFQMRDYARAVLKYQDVIDKYKKSIKYKTALLKQGISFMRLGRVKAGRLLLQDVADKFPKSTEAKRAKGILKGN